MVMDIRSLVPGHTKANLGKTDKSRKKGSSNESSSNAVEADDSVSLTGQASQINSLIQQMKAAPVLDPDRVSPVKEKLDNNKYEIEYEQVANKMLDFEADYYRH
ncbi:flagellar biosynthesis anti-sigma factor FlgM [Aliikangiella coralliicola]|uniref:Negative regulator of flagellin synthesis n=1 Tax=Aliikangiella coralliicola TaxID=2592383 RepID=A0A545U5Y3_9GAMM|nr:flagellar biosynthesis anti-sigma factor FlgM [Aliikangiella coralliicola]TQV84877.1 flagellar biosynthesis anti-sigma factor FlgM [Aliikangiella coralliicola]